MVLKWAQSNEKKKPQKSSGLWKRQGESCGCTHLRVRPAGLPSDVSPPILGPASRYSTWPWGRRQTRPSALCTHTSAFLDLNRFCFNDYVSDTVIVRKARMLPHLCTIFFVLLAAVSCGCTPGTLSSEDQIPGEGQLVVVIFHLNSRRDT